MVSFKKHFVENLSTKIKKKLDKQWIIKEVDNKNLDQEKMEIDLMKNPFGKEPP
jgi:ribosomal protein L35